MTIDVNNELADDISVLNGKKTHVVLNELLSDEQQWSQNQRIGSLLKELHIQISEYKRDYQRMMSNSSLQIEKIDNELKKLEYIKRQKEELGTNFIDSSFLKFRMI